MISTVVFPRNNSTTSTDRRHPIDQEHPLSNPTSSANTRHPRRLDEDDVDSTRRLISTTPPPSRHPLQTLALVIASTTTTMTTTTTTTATAMSTLLMSTAVMSIATAAASAAARRKATTAAKQLTAQKPKRLANAAKLAWNKFRMDPKVQNVPDLRQYMGACGCSGGLRGLHKSPSHDHEGGTAAICQKKGLAHQLWLGSQDARKT